MIRYFAAHPNAGNLLMLIFIVVGLLALPGIRKSTFPLIERNDVQVQVAYPGATAQDIEDSICRPLEDAIDGISNVYEKRCEARSHLGTLTVEMREGGDFRTFMDDVNRAVNGTNDLPAQAEEPVVTEVGRTDSVITVAVAAPLPRAALKDLAEEIKTRLQRDPDIPLVEISGFGDRQLNVQISADNLRRYGLSISDIAAMLGRQSVSTPAGTLETPQRDIELRFDDEGRSITELARLVVLSDQHGGELRLGEIAHIEDTFEDPENRIEYNGLPAAFLAIRKNHQDDSLTVLNAVQRVVAAERARLPEAVTLAFTQDMTSIIKDRLSMLISNAVQGLLLVFLALLCFFSLRYTFWVVMGLPISFLGAFFLISQAGLSIDMLSMVALLLALGILMDDGIVIAESIAAELNGERSLLDAIHHGVRKVARGVFASFLTTTLIFGSIVFIKGDLGQLLKVIPLVLLMVITISLVEAFLILPAHLYHSLARPKPGSSWLTRQQDRFGHRFERLRDRISASVKSAIQYRYGVLGGTLCLLLISVGMLASGVLRFSAFPDLDGDTLQARIQMQAGTPLHQTEAVVERLLKGLEATNTALSENGHQLVQGVSVMYSVNQDAHDTGPHLATISVDLRTAEQRQARIDDIIADWRDRITLPPGVANVLYKEPALGPAGQAVEIRLSGTDPDTLSDASHELQQWLRGYPGVINVFDDLHPGRREFRLHLKPGATALGLNALTLAEQLRAAYQGIKVDSISEPNDNFEIRVQLTPDSRNHLGDFDQFPIIHPGNGAVIPLHQLAEVVPTRNWSRIQRINGQTTVTVFADLDTRLANASAILADTRSYFLPGLLNRYDGLQYRLAGEARNTDITRTSMRNGFIVGLFGVFMLLAFQFRNFREPIIVMLAIPLSLIGVIWGHLLMGHNLSMPSITGFISLAGIVVNNSILLVEFIRRRLGEGADIHTAAVLACRDRSRAIILTTATTIAGMLPLLLETSLQAQVLIPLVISISFGLLATTFLVLYYVPCMYIIFDDWGWIRRAAAGSEPTPPVCEPAS